MRPFEYLLKFGFMYAVSLGLLLGLAPWLWKNASDSSTIPQQTEPITQFELFTPSPQSFGAENYLGLQLTAASGQTFRKVFYVPDREHIAMLNKLYSLQLLNRSIALHEQLPLRWTLQSNPALLNSIAYRRDEGGNDQVAIGNEFVVGQRNSIGTFFQYVVAGIFALAGLGLLPLVTLELGRQLKIFNQTGHLPELPNSVDSKWEGLKFLLRGFKKK